MHTYGTDAIPPFGVSPRRVNSNSVAGIQKWDFTALPEFAGDATTGGVSGVLWSHAEAVRSWTLGTAFPHSFARHETMDGFASGDARYRYRIIPTRLEPKPDPFDLIWPFVEGGVLDPLAWYADPVLAVSDHGVIKVADARSQLGVGMGDYLDNMMTDDFQHVGPSEPVFGSGFPALRLEHTAGVLLEVETGRPLFEMRRNSVIAPVVGSSVESATDDPAETWLGVAAMSSVGRKLYELVELSENNVGILSYDLDSWDQQVFEVEGGTELGGLVVALAARPHDLVIAIETESSVHIERWHHYPGGDFSRSRVATIADGGAVTSVDIRSVNTQDVLVSVARESDTVLYRMTLQGRCVKKVTRAVSDVLPRRAPWSQDRGAVISVDAGASDPWLQVVPWSAFSSPTKTQIALHEPEDGVCLHY